MDPLATVLLNKPESIIQLGKLGWNTVKKFFDDCDAKDSIHYGDAYFDYLENTVHRISQIKTLIYRHVPKFLYLFYEYPDIEYKEQTISTANAQDILDINNKLIVTGIGGIGKSLLLKHFFLNIAQYGHYIPVLIELRKFNQMDSKEISLYDVIYQNLSDNGFKLEDKYYKYSLDAGGYVILLDGFDEVNRDKSQKVFDQIQSFSQRYHKNHFVVSSRPSDRFVGWNDFHGITLCDLTQAQVFNLIKKIDFDEAVKKPFTDALNNKLFRKYQAFASNPLLLTIMLLTFSVHATLPTNLNEFYEQAFSTLYDGHDATKDCFVRDIRSRLSYENFKTLFAYICFKSYFKGQFEFSESSLCSYIEQAQKKFPELSFSIADFKVDLTQSICMMIREGLHYRFIHRSFQEYFAAWYTCKLTDDIQSKLLTHWLSESNIYTEDGYLQSLFTLQPDKVNKIVFYPGIKKLKELYDKNGFSYDVICSIFNGINIFVPQGKKHRPRIGFSVQNRYLCNILYLTYGLNNYSSSDANSNASKEDRVIDKLAATIPDESFSHTWSFEDLKKIITPEELIDCLSWCDNCLQFCFDLYEKYSDSSALKKRKVSSIIDEL